MHRGGHIWFSERPHIRGRMIGKERERRAPPSERSDRRDRAIGEIDRAWRQASDPIAERAIDLPDHSAIGSLALARRRARDRSLRSLGCRIARSSEGTFIVSSVPIINSANLLLCPRRVVATLAKISAIARTCRSGDAALTVSVPAVVACEHGRLSPKATKRPFKSKGSKR